MNVKSFLTDKYVFWKTRRIFKKLNNTDIEVPIDVRRVKNVLIILPREMEYVDSAVSFIRKLKQHYRSWHYMMLDMDKIQQHQMNRLDLPNQQFTDELQKNKFELVLDLNIKLDLRIIYLVGMLNIPYRVQLGYTPGRYYNIVVKSRQSRIRNFDYVLHNLQSIFIRESKN